MISFLRPPPAVGRRLEDAMYDPRGTIFEKSYLEAFLPPLFVLEVPLILAPDYDGTLRIFDSCAI